MYTKGKRISKQFSREFRTILKNEGDIETNFNIFKMMD